MDKLTKGDCTKHGEANQRPHENHTHSQNFKNPPSTTVEVSPEVYRSQGTVVVHKETITQVQ